MRLKSAIALTLLLALASCAPARQAYTGPGCLVYLYPLPASAGIPLPVRTDTADLAAPWRDSIKSAKVVYGMWRLYSEPDFVGFMGDYKGPAVIGTFSSAKKLGSLRCLEPEPAPPPLSY